MVCIYLTSVRFTLIHHESAWSNFACSTPDKVASFLRSECDEVWAWEENFHILEHENIFIAFVYCYVYF